MRTENKICLSSELTVRIFAVALLLEVATAKVLLLNNLYFNLAHQPQYVQLHILAT